MKACLQFAFCCAQRIVLLTKYHLYVKVYPIINGTGRILANGRDIENMLDISNESISDLNGLFDRKFIETRSQQTLFPFKINFIDEE